MYKLVEATPTITAGAYSAGDAVGGLLTFEDVATPYANTCEIVTALLTDNAKQNALTHLALFRSPFTPTADNAAFAVSDSDLANIISVLHFEAANYASFNANSVGIIGYAALAVSVPIVLTSGQTDLLGQLYTAGTPTYVATDDISVKLIVRR